MSSKDLYRVLNPFNNTHTVPVPPACYKTSNQSHIHSLPDGLFWVQSSRFWHVLTVGIRISLPIFLSQGAWLIPEPQSYYKNMDQKTWLWTQAPIRTFAHLFPTNIWLKLDSTHHPKHLLQVWGFPLAVWLPPFLLPQLYAPGRRLIILNSCCLSR